jgi:hypothetical protein
MKIDEPNEKNKLDGFKIYNLLNEIYLKCNPYDNPDGYAKECKKQFADIEKDKNIESIKEDLFRRWTNGQLDSIKDQGMAPDKNKVIPYLQNGVFVITDYQYLFNKMMYT